MQTYIALVFIGIFLAVGMVNSELGAYLAFVLFGLFMVIDLYLEYGGFWEIIKGFFGLWGFVTVVLAVLLFVSQIEVPHISEVLHR